MSPASWLYSGKFVKFFTNFPYSYYTPVRSTIQLLSHNVQEFFSRQKSEADRLGLAVR